MLKRGKALSKRRDNTVMRLFYLRTIFRFMVFIVILPAMAKAYCSLPQIKNIFPTTKEVGDVIEQARYDSGPYNSKDGSITYSRTWRGGPGGYRDLTIRLYIYPKPNLARLKVEKYCKSLGSRKITLPYADIGCTAKRRYNFRRYYMLAEKCAVIVLWTDYPDRRLVDPQDYLLKPMVERIKKLNCLCSTSQQNTSANRTATYKVSASKKGFLNDWDKREINIDTTKRLIVWGTVYDNKGKELPSAIVTFKILGKTFTKKSDSNGYFEFDLTINPKGNKTLKFNEDLHLKKPLPHLTAQVLSKTLAADGRIQNVKVRLTSDKGVVRNKKLYISTDNMPLLHNGRIVNYAKFSYDSKYITTDSNGVATFKVKSPKLDVNLVNRSNDKALFPIISRYTVYSLENGKKEKVGFIKLSFLSPKPHITKVLLPGGVEEQLWQSMPSRVFIEDIDSNHFSILIRGWGRFKSKGSSIRYNTLIRQFDGKEFDFYFSPRKIGFDLNDQPQLWKDLLTTNLNVLGSIFIPLAQNGKLPLKYPASDEFKSLIDSYVIQFGTKDYVNLIKQAHNSPSLTNITDGAVGGALLGDAINNLLSGKNIPLGQTMQLEVLKAVYANLTTIYKAYAKYGKIARAYQDIDFLPIIVIITDSDGYKDRYLRYISVKIWKEGE
ncbi:carboxypeptidase-like regulatory domain-containing protein [Hippea maritima]|nr:carboxypeptidase-like regulatory domain-containing protein [Hippea maritima]